MLFTNVYQKENCNDKLCRKFAVNILHVNIIQERVYLFSLLLLIQEQHNKASEHRPDLFYLIY